MASSKNRSRQQKRRLRTENLESRQLMAGDVSVAVEGGDLVVRGDNASNGVQVYQTNIGSKTWHVRGLKQAGQNTRINGSTGVRTFHGIYDDVRIIGKGGSDRIVVKNGRTRDDLRIYGWSGNDDIQVTNVTVGDDFKVEGSSGNDDILVQNSVVKDDLFIYSDHKGQSYQDNVQVWHTSVGDNAFVRTRGGNDDVILAGVKIADNLTLDTGSGHDDIDILGSNVDRFYGELGSGNDDIHVNKSKFNRFEVDGESGSDKLLDGKDVDYGYLKRKSIGFKHV